VSEEDWARRLWDYHHVNHALERADCIIVLGSHDTRVAERAADLAIEGWAPLVVFSGRRGSLTEAWPRTEAEVFAEIAAARGLAGERILLETRATNTGQNVDYSRALLAAKGIRPARALAVQKPYMERRTLATFEARWPTLEVRVTSPLLGWEDYPTPEIPREEVIHIMVGDLQRLLLYPELGFSSRQEVPAPVLEAYEGLVAAGYTRRLVRS
jgi:uncharacterized SAM-binding protein YcdF (DUF218 family)